MTSEHLSLYVLFLFDVYAYEAELRRCINLLSQSSCQDKQDYILLEGDQGQSSEVLHSWHVQPTVGTHYDRQERQH